MDSTTADERREMREAAEAACAEILAEGLLIEPFTVDPKRQLSLLIEHDAQAAKIARLREALRDAAGTAGRIAASERKAIDDAVRLRNEQNLDRAAVRRLVEALPRCAEEKSLGCSSPATTEMWCDEMGSQIEFCDDHFGAGADLPHAAPLRALQARMVTWGEAAAAPVAEAVREPAEEPVDAHAVSAEDVPCAPQRNGIQGCSPGVALFSREDYDDPPEDQEARIRTAEARASEASEPPASAPSAADLAAHGLDVARIRKALETGTVLSDPEDIEDAIDWPAFWSRRARLGAAADAIEEPVRATVEWMQGETILSSEASARKNEVFADEAPRTGGSCRAVEQRLVLTEAEARQRDRVFFDDGRTCRIIPEVWHPGKEPSPSRPLGLPPEPDDEQSAYDAAVAARMATRTGSKSDE